MPSSQANTHDREDATMADVPPSAQVDDQEMNEETEEEEEELPTRIRIVRHT